MPYIARPTGSGKYGVYIKGEDGKPKGKPVYEHDDEEKAKKQTAALNINVHKEKKEIVSTASGHPELISLGDVIPNMEIAEKCYDSMVYGWLSPDDPRVNYGSLLGTDTQACANCAWFVARSNQCKVMWGDAVATGKCDLWLETKDNKYVPDPAPVYIVDPPAEGSKEEKSALSGVLDWMKSLITSGKSKDMPQSGFKAFEDRTWVAWWTNNAEDKTAQTFSEKAIDNYIALVDAGKLPYPDLWYWHLPIRSGKALWVARDGHFGVAAGKFDDTETGDEFYKYYTNSKSSKEVSHGYLYPKGALIDGVYHWFATFEISPLPAGKAANPYTSFEEIKAMAVTDEKRKELEGIIGVEKATKFFQDTEVMNKSLEEMNVNFKEKVPDSVPAVDSEARAMFKSMMEMQNGMFTQVKSMTESFQSVATSIKSLTDDVEKRLAKLEQVQQDTKDLMPRSTQDPSTIVPATNPVVAHLAEKQLGEDTKGMGVFGEILGYADRVVAAGQP